MLRITGGIYRGSTLYCPKSIRPSSGRVKEYIFSQIGQYTIGARVLDLFAGSGALGIEALSRKAAEAVFVEKSSPAIKTIQRNLEKLKLEAKIIKADSLQFISSFKGEPFDLIFIDPPYNDYNPQTIFKVFEESDMLKDGGHLIYEMLAGSPEPNSRSLILSSFRTHGDTTIGIWFRKG